MGKGRRRRSFSDSSESESGSDSESSSSDADGAGRQSISGSDQEADNWVLCDRCTKWRRIPATFAGQIREDTPWYCEHNPNKAFASCSVPQELTNEEIDADAHSDGAGEEDHDEESLKRRRIPAVWQLLKDNILAHRKRKVQDEDDIMICHCKPVYRGGDGCGPDCINRMLCIECVPGFCPSEDKCTNQMFSKRMYASLEIRRAGAKGFGLFALEDIRAGQFIIEYIGEVLEEDEYQRRKDYYMSVGQRHYYFMNIGNGEVIDACRKGNISRFINHSCEPNCETQKWLVHGELAIGLFAVRDIPKDTELTFDYNFERYGDKPMRCYCRSTNCRKFIGGMQDNYDVSLLPPVELDDVSHDLPPIMLTDTDMDPNMRMLLDWRVGARVDKGRELGMVTRLERVCKSRNVPWNVRHFYGQEPLTAPQQCKHSGAAPGTTGVRTDPGAAPATTSGRTSDKPPAAGDAAAGAAATQAKAKQQRKAEKVAAGAATGGTGKGKAAGVSSAKQHSEGSTHAAGVAKLRIDVGTGSSTPAPSSGGQGGSTAPHSARQPPPTTPAATPEVAQVRGPKALFKQWKIMQQQDITPAPAVEDKAAATPSSPPSPRSLHSPPSPQSPPSPRSSLSLDNDDAALDELRNAAAEAAKHVPLRKRLRRLPPKPPAAEAPPENGQTASGQNGPAQATAKRADGSGTGSQGAAHAAAAGTVSGGVARKNSFGSANADPAAVAAAPSYSPPRSTSPPPYASGRNAGGFGGAGGSAGRRLRSEIDRRLEEVVGSKGGIRDPSRQNIIKVLRLFNLCDIGSNTGRNNGFGSAAGGRYVNGGMHRNGDDGVGAGPSSLTARQRARMADLSLLLDVLLKTTSTAAKKELVACGLLTQLHQAMGRNTGKEYCVILRKVLRAVEGLPLEANDVYAVRSAHGNFADMLKQLSNNPDYDVRTKATALLKKFPSSAVTDQRLLQLMAAPPVRFGHGRGSGGMRGMGGGGFGGGGGSMLPLAMQQQILQQQQLIQQHLLKQQMLRLKEAAGNGGPVQPGLGPGTEAGADGTAPGGMRRTSSNTSLGDDAADPNDTAAQNVSLPGLPPLGPGRQRAMVAAAAAAAFASRPGLFRPMVSRNGLPLPNGVAAASMGLGPGGLARGMVAMGMGPPPSSFSQRPPSPADSLAAAYNGASAADDHLYHSSKRRKFSHPHGLDGSDTGLGFAGGPLPGPPPRPPYSLAGGSYRHLGGDASGRDRDYPGPSSNLPLPPPPPHPLHALQHYPRGGSEERDLAALDRIERLSMEEIFALRRPYQRPTALPPAKGRPPCERHPHGEPTVIVTLFALGIYGSYAAVVAEGAGSKAAAKPHAAAGEVPVASVPMVEEGGTGKGGEATVATATETRAPGQRVGGEPPRASSPATEHGECWSPLICPDGPPMSPIVEQLPPPPPIAGAAPAAAQATDCPLPLPPPPPGGVPLDAASLRPLRIHAASTLGRAACPSPFHPQGSPAPGGGWDSVPGSAVAARATASTTSTPTVSGFGAATQHGAFGPPPPSVATTGAAAITAPGGTTIPVVPVSSLSDWRNMPSAGATAGAAVAIGEGVPLVSSVPLPGMVRPSPHTSPEHMGTALAAGGHAPGRGAGAEETENIDDWLRPVYSHHADVWDEPDPAFEAYVSDMVRHRLGKYMQPEHPSRVSVQEATMLRSKVYGEVVAKERRAWEERRRAGVYKPIERHKLEANLKDFVRSTIKRMRDREKEKAAAAGAPHGAGQAGSGVPAGARAPGSAGHHHHHSHHGQHHHGNGPHRYSMSTPLAATPPPRDGAPEGAPEGAPSSAKAAAATTLQRLNPTPMGGTAAEAASRDTLGAEGQAASLAMRGSVQPLVSSLVLEARFVLPGAPISSAAQPGPTENGGEGGAVATEAGAAGQDTAMADVPSV